MTSPSRPRVGHIEFLNCLPLYWGLEQSDDVACMDLSSDTPDRLSDALVAGDLDIGPISLVEALRHAEDLVVLPEVAVGALGSVMSVCLVSKRPVSELDSAVVALGSTSRTSVELARLILERRWGLAPTYLTCEPDLPRMLEQADAAVLIGDPALEATLASDHGEGVVVTDLAREWLDWQGLPMVFAVWAVRREYIREHPKAVRAVRIAFARALVSASEHPRDVAAAGAAVSGFTVPQLLVYYRVIDFSLGAAQWRGIQAFAGLLGSSELAAARELEADRLDVLRSTA